MSALHRSVLHPRWLSAVGFALLAYGFHRIGVIEGLYQEFFWFQMATHLLSAAALALLLAVAATEFDLRGYAFLTVVVAGTAFGAVSWELVEYFRVIPSLIWWGVDDSLLDLFVDAVGVGFVLWAFRDRVRTEFDPVVGTPRLSAPPGLDD